MSSATPMFKVGAVVLGYVGVVASWRRPADPKDTKLASYRSVVIQTTATSDEGVHEPAQSITIGSREGLLALRHAIDEALSEGGAA